MNFKTENINNNVIFTVLDSSINGKSSADLKSRILFVAQSDINALILDLSNVIVTDSSGLGALLLAHRQLKDYDIPVYLVGVQSFVKNLLNVTRIEDIFLYADTVEEAIKSLENK